jgi:RimJ/RimL family protein N-acetyltransferase
LGERHSLYGLLKNPPTLSGSKTVLRPKQLDDAFNDYQWRKDHELCRLDATYPILSTFEEFYKLYVEQTCQSDKALRFAIETLEGKHIGNCSCFNIDMNQSETEIGIMIADRDYWNQGYGADALETAITYIFSATTITRIHLKTLKWNIRAQKCFEKCGFSPCGQLNRGEYSFILMEIYHPPQQ